MRKLEDRRGEADMLGRVALIAGALGRQEERLEAATAGALAKELGDDELRMRSLMLAGDANLALEAYAAAVKCYEQVLPHFEQHGPPRGVAAVTINMGTALTKLRRYDEARAMLEKGIAAAEAAGDRQFLGNGLADLVLLYGELDDDKAQLPLLERLHESDGLLTVFEIIGMDIGADLVTLSACESARGKVYDGDGIVGLTRAFMHAGTPRVLCSLWKVDDEATSALMIRFCELWNPKEGKGLGAADALAKAQAFVRSHERWRHPYYWAAWVLWGLPV